MCQLAYQRGKLISTGQCGHKLAKRHLLLEHGHQCWGCGLREWQGRPIALELEHTDGNSENNDLANLKILCPNCHSQTDTYRSKNAGRGRRARRKARDSQATASTDLPE